MSHYLIQRQVDGEIIPTIMSEIRLIDYINMADCHGETYEILIASHGSVKSGSCTTKDGSRRALLSWWTNVVK